MMISQLVIANNQAPMVLEGSIYIEEARSLQEKLFRLMETGTRNIAVDMSAVDYIDSSGLGALVSVNKQLLRKGGSMKICGIQGLVREVFELTRLDRVFAIEAS